MNHTKLVKYSVIILLIGFFVAQVIRSLEKYFAYPTYVSTKIVNQANADFPAITICPIPSSGYKSKVLKENGIESVKRYNSDEYDLSWSSNNSKVNEVELFDLATCSLKELVQGVFIRYNRADPVSKF